MSLTETPSNVVPLKPRKPRRKKRQAKVAAKPATAFAGMTATDCPSGCGPAGCIISGKSYCGHPFKGGLQGRDIQNDAAVARVEAAKKALGKAKVKVGGI